MISSADLGAGVVSVPLGCGGSLVQIHLHVHADADQDCTIDIDLVTTEEGIQIRLRGAQSLDDADQQPDNEDKPRSTGNLLRDFINEISAEMDTPEWEAEHEASLVAAAAEEEEALLAEQGEPPAEQVGDDPESGGVEDSATRVYLGKLFDWTVAERVEDGVVFTRGDHELFRVPEERFEEMRQLFVLEDAGLINMHVDGFRVVREGWDACIFDGDIFFEAIPVGKFATLTRLFT